jgi:protoheme IX farnesyltransferase
MSVFTPSLTTPSLKRTSGRKRGFAVDSATATPQDFLTLTKPGVLSLVVYTAAIGLFLAPTTMHPVLSLITIFAIALGSAGAGAFNMWYDRDIDTLMKRTKKRPIPRGAIAPNDALIFAILLSVTAVMLLYMATIWQQPCF